MKKTTQAVMVLMGLAVLGCAKEDSSQVSPTSVFTSYAATYDDTTKTISAEATFNTGGPTGTYLILDDSSSVTFDNAPLNEETDAFNQVSYNVQTSTEPLTNVNLTHIFTYVDTGGTTYVNSFNFPGLVSVAYSANTVHTASGIFTISWTSSDSLGSDGLTLQLQSDSGFITESISGNVPQGTSGSTTFTPADMANWTEGAYNAQVCRGKDASSINAPAEGGSLSASSCTALFQVLLEP